MNLSAEKERDIIVKYRETGDKSLLTPIFSYLYKIFTFKVNSYIGLYHLDKDDIIQELIIQALKCLESFDVNSNIKFTSYAGGKTMIWRKLRDLRNKEKDHIIFSDDIIEHNSCVFNENPSDVVSLGEQIDLAGFKMSGNQRKVLIKSFLGMELNIHKNYVGELRRTFRKHLIQGE